MQFAISQAPSQQILRHAAAVLLAIIASSAAFAQNDDDALSEVARRDPAAAAILDLPRETPTAKMRAVAALVDLGHPGAAKSILNELNDADLSDEEKAGLVEHFGTARMMRLIRLTGPLGSLDLPELRQFAQSCLDAAAAEARDPQRLARAIESLDGDSRARREALAALASAGDAGIEACIEALANNPGQRRRAGLLQALTAMHPAVDQPLLALLDKARGNLRGDAARLAGELRLFESLPWLAMLSVAPDPQTSAAAQRALRAFELPQPSPAEAATLVRQELTDLIERGAENRDVAAASNPWWTWDEGSQDLRKIEASPAQKRALKAARLARALVAAGGALRPEDHAEALLYGWEEASALDMPPSEELTEQFQSLDARQLSAMLAQAQQRRLYAAARHCAELLGKRKDEQALASLDGKPAPLARALTSPNQELRFAALQAVLEIDPATSFAGASHVVESLWFFAAGAGEPTAVAAAATIPRANLWAGQLRQLGYDAVAATTGRSALAAALDRSRAARLMLVAIDSDISLPQVRETIFQLRRSTSAADTPIAVLCSLPRLESLRRLADDDPLMIAEPRPHGDGAMAALVERLTALPGRGEASGELRVRRAKFALQEIARLLAEEAHYDELIRDAELVDEMLYHPELARAAIDVLQALGTSASQTTLANYANSAGLTIESRRRAAAAFAASVKRFGVQLPPSEIDRQYDRFNASDDSDEETHALLGSLLDVIEGK